MVNNKLYKVIKGNEYIKTGEVVDVKARYGLKHDEAIELTDKNETWDLAQCLTTYYKGKDLRELGDISNYEIIDRDNITSKRWHNLKLSNIIYNNCNVNDVSLHGGELKNIVFLNCNIDILDLRYAKVNNVKFLYCGTMYGVKIDHATLKDVVYVKSTLNK